MTLFPPNSRFCGSIELCFPHPLKQQHQFYPLWYFWSCPWWEGRYSKPCEKNWGSYSHHHLKEFGQMLLPAPGWHILKLMIDGLNTEVAFFDPVLAVSHWIYSVRRRCRCRCYLLYISICRILRRSWTGRRAFVSEARWNWEQEFYYDLLLLLLDFWQMILISCWIFDKGFYIPIFDTPKSF